MGSELSRCQWCGKDFDPQHTIEAYRPEGDRYGSVCSEQCLALAGCVSKKKKDRLDKEAAIRRSSEEGRQLLQQEKYEEAIAAADKMAALDGKCVEAKVIKGIAFARNGRFELAIPELEEALKLDSGHAEAKTTLEALFSDETKLSDYARAKYEEKAYDTVVLLTSQMMERSPSCFAACLLRGKSYRQSKKHKEAIQDFAKALTCSPEDARREVLRERGACHFDLKDFQAAIEDCTASLQIDGQDASALLTRGKSYLASKEHALAAIDFYESARLDPALKGDAAKGIEAGEKNLTPTMLAEVAENPSANLTTGQRQSLDKIIEIYKLKEKVAEIEKTKQQATSPLMVALILLGVLSVLSCGGLFAVPIRYEWYGPFLFLNLAWFFFAAAEGVRFRRQQELDRTVNSSLVEEVEKHFLVIKEHETSFGLDRAPQRDSDKSPAIIVVGLLLLVISAGWLWGFIKPQERVRAEVVAADQQWDAGQKAEAATKYKEVVETGLGKISSENRPKLFQRLVEYDLGLGDIASAKALIEKANKEKVALPPEVVQGIKSREDQAAADQAKKEAAEREATAQAERAKKEAAQKAEQEQKRQAEIAAQKKKLAQVPDLIRRLKDENAKVRAVAAAGLAEIKPLPLEALEALLIAVKERGDPLSDIIRISATRALGNCDPVDGRTVKALTEAMMTDEAGAVQVLALGELKKLGKVAIPAITKALTHPSHQMRSMAAFELGRAGKEAKSSVPDLLKAMREEQDDQTRIMMAGAALRLDPDEPSSIPILIKALDPGRDPEARRVAAELLAEAGPRAKAAIPALEAMLTSSDSADVRVAKKALEKIKK